MSQSRRTTARKHIVRPVLIRAVAVLAALVLLSTGAVALGHSTASAGPTPSVASCTFTDGGQTVNGLITAPGTLTGAKNGDSVSISCTGVTPNDQMAIIESSPLAAVAQPVGFPALASDTDVDGANLGTTASASGSFSDATLTVASGSSFSAGIPGGIPGFVAGSDPEAACPPTQAQINAGLTDCFIAVADLTDATASNPSIVFYGEALLDFAGQGSPASPTLAAKQTLGTLNDGFIVSDATSPSAYWWGQAWFGGGYAANGITPLPYSVPNADIQVNGSAPTSSAVQIAPPVYCFWGGLSASSCNPQPTTIPNPLPGGTLFPAKISGSVVASADPVGATVAVYEANGTAFPGNSTNAAYPNFVTASATVGPITAIPVPLPIHPLPCHPILHGCI